MRPGGIDAADRRTRASGVTSVERLCGVRTSEGDNQKEREFLLIS